MRVIHCAQCLQKRALSRRGGKEERERLKLEQSRLQADLRWRLHFHLFHEVALVVLVPALLLCFACLLALEPRPGPGEAPDKRSWCSLAPLWVLLAVCLGSLVSMYYYRLKSGLREPSRSVCNACLHLWAPHTPSGKRAVVAFVLVGVGTGTRLLC